MSLPVFMDDSDAGELVLSEDIEEDISQDQRPASKLRKTDPSNDLKEIAQQMRNSQTRKLDIIEKMIATPPQSDLELFFASMCKTVEKFSPINQAEIKMNVTKLVNEAEILHLRTQYDV